MSGHGSPIEPEQPLGPAPPRPETPLPPMNLFGRNESKGLARKPTVVNVNIVSPGFHRINI